MRASSLVRKLAVISAAGLALYILTLTGLAALIFFGGVSAPGTESDHLDDEAELWHTRPAVLEIRVDFDPARSRTQDLVLRLDRVDMDAMGLAAYVLRPERNHSFALHTNHLLESKADVYEHCLKREAVLHNYTNQVIEHVFPPGLCLRSGEPLELVIGR